MPLHLDSATSADVTGSDDPVYCSHCYQASAFVLPDLTVEQMQARVLERLRVVGVPEPQAQDLVARIPRLKRWR
jgi:Putative zinc ribbon domain